MIGILADTVSVITVILIPIIKFFFFPKSPSKNITTFLTPNWIVAVVIVSIIVVVINYAKERKKRRTLQDTINLNYYKLLHDYRNEINQIECYYKKGNLNLDLLSRTIESFSIGAVDYLSDTLSALTGKKVCCCIKTIVGEGFESIDYQDACVKTFVRSNNTQTVRKTMDENPSSSVVKINENTDFMEIVAEDRTGNDSVFYHQDLIAYNKKLETIGERYRNTTKDWDKYYKAAIVAPIRIANKRLFYTNDNSAYNLLGFLCADTLDTHSFTKQNKETYTYLVKAYAATLYNILSKYQFYMKQLSTNSDSVSVNSIKKIPTAQNQTYRNKNTNKSRRRK